MLQQHFHQQDHQQLFYATRGEEEEEASQPPKKRSHFPHSEEEQHTREYVGFGDKMDRRPHRLGLLKGTTVGGGEIVEVQGGHIVRSTGRKDRHSKVCTAKGPRDRRVRLSAHTAIQFYDVQDRLGYDRPSKAVDWLIKKAKSAIDELAELPPWNPTATAQPSAAAQDQQVDNQTTDSFVGSSRMEVEQQDASGYGFQHQHLNNAHSSGFLPPSLDSDAIADTIKSFFPVATSSTPVQHFHNYPPDLLPRSTSHAQDLRLSLHSFQDPILHHHPSSQQSIFSTSSPLHFDSASASASASWSVSDQPHHEMGRFQRMLAGTDAGFIFTSPPQPSLSHNPFFPQRGPLQSSNSPQFRAWPDQSIALMNHSQMQSVNQSSISGFGFASAGFSGFRIPARIQGEEEHDADKPPSASRH